MNKPVIVSNDEWKDLIGIQFALGGTNPAIGLNCYGLIREVYRQLQIDLPERQETALDGKTVTEAAGNDWTRLDEPQPYAVALIRSTGNLSRYHLAIVTPELTLLHSLPKKGVVVSPIADYAEDLIGFYRYTPGEGKPLPAAEGQVGRIIGAIVVAAVAAYVAGPLGYYVGWHTVVGAVAGMAVSIAGGMIINAELPEKLERGGE